MEIKKDLIRFVLLLFITAGYAGGQNRVQPDTNYKQIYEAAVIDAMVAEESEICSTLVAIKPDNYYLRWLNGYVLVVNWTKDCINYSVGDTAIIKIISILCLCQLNS